MTYSAFAKCSLLLLLGFSLLQCTKESPTTGPQSEDLSEEVDSRTTCSSSCHEGFGFAPGFGKNWKCVLDDYGISLSNAVVKYNSSYMCFSYARAYVEANCEINPQTCGGSSVTNCSYNGTTNPWFLNNSNYCEVTSSDDYDIVYYPNAYHCAVKISGSTFRSKLNSNGPVLQHSLHSLPMYGTYSNLMQQAKYYAYQCSSSCSDDCGAGYSGTHSGSSYYLYPTKTIDLSCESNGSTISLYVNALGVPNRFNIYNSYNTLIASSGWMGYASYGGPWGSSLNGPSTKTLNFSKATTLYYLKVETVPPAYQSDSWSVSVSCQ